MCIVLEGGQPPERGDRRFVVGLLHCFPAVRSFEPPLISGQSYEFPSVGWVSSIIVHFPQEVNWLCPVNFVSFYDARCPHF